MGLFLRVATKPALLVIGLETFPIVCKPFAIPNLVAGLPSIFLPAVAVIPPVNPPRFSPVTNGTISL